MSAPRDVAAHAVARRNSSHKLRELGVMKSQNHDKTDERKR